MRYLLDTSVFVHAVLLGMDGIQSRTVRRILLDEQAQLEMSAVSLTEIAIKHGIGKLKLPPDLAREGVDDLRLTLVPYMPEHAYGFSHVPSLHGDPFDRMIIATGLIEEIPILSSDRNFLKYSMVQVIW